MILQNAVSIRAKMKLQLVDMRRNSPLKDSTEIISLRFYPGM